MIHIILGTKAQLIKMAPIMAHLCRRDIPYNFIHTGQHQATMSEMFHDFSIKPPDVQLYDGPDIISVRKMFVWFVKTLWQAQFNKEKIFGQESKGIVLVHGDTFSTLLGALMGRLAGLPVGHVESGLRSFHIFHPFPEELTRILTFRLSTILYCPGQWAVDNVKNLKKEKVNTHFNTMLDTLTLTSRKNSRTEHIPNYPYALVSLHRYENIFNKESLRKLLKSIEYISSCIKLVFILHPPTENQLKKYGFFEIMVNNSRIDLRQRYHHSDFLSLLKKSEFVVTDGGSLQEETFYLGLPCLIMRKTTERQEGVGENVVISMYDAEKIKYFVENYRKYRRKPVVPKLSPSEIVIESALHYACQDS